MVEVNNQTRSSLDTAKLLRVAEQVLALYPTDKELSIAIIGDRLMAKLNQQYRGKAGPTDVLSFPGEYEFLGEVILDYQYLKRQAKREGQTLEEELYFILIHGILHLLGHDDQTEPERQAMIKLGHQVRARITI